MPNADAERQRKTPRRIERGFVFDKILGSEMIQTL